MIYRDSAKHVRYTQTPEDRRSFFVFANTARVLWSINEAAEKMHSQAVVTFTVTSNTALSEQQISSI